MDDRIISGYAAVIERLTISDIVPCRFVISNVRPQFLDVRLFEKIRLRVKENSFGCPRVMFYDQSMIPLWWIHLSVRVRAGDMVKVD